MPDLVCTISSIERLLMPRMTIMKSLFSLSACALSLIATFITIAHAGTTKYTYDALDRLTTVQHDDGKAVEYVYDKIGNRTGTVASQNAVTTYKITVSSNRCGSVIPSGVVTVFQGGSQTFQMLPNASTKLVDVVVDGVSQGPVQEYNFTNVTQDHTLVANFIVPDGSLISQNGIVTQADFDLAMRISVGIIHPTPAQLVHGDVAPMANGIIIPDGKIDIDDVMLIGMKANGVVNWSTSCESTSMAKPLPRATIVTVVASPVGGIFNTPPSITLTCSDSAGLACSYIYYTTDGTTPTTSSAVYAGPIPIASTVALKFFAVDSAGNIGSVRSENYTIDPVPPSGTVTINQGSSATFSSTVSLDISCSDNMVTCSQMQFSNDNVTWSTPETYAASKSWNLTSGDGVKTVYVRFKDSVGNWSSPVNSTISAVSYYTITTSAGNGGTISPTTATIVTGNSQIVTVTPLPSYHLVDVMVDGVSKGAISTYTFNNVSANHSIFATFEMNPHVITTSAGAGGSISPASATVVNGSNQTFTITPGIRYQIADVTVDGVSQGAIGSYTFTNVTAPHTLAATFALSACANQPVRIAGKGSYATFQAAYDAAVEGDTIQSLGQEFTESFTANKAISIIIDGGYDCNFTINPDTTIIHGAPHISSGTVKLKNIRIAQ